MVPPLSFESSFDIIIRWNTEPKGRFITDGDGSKIYSYLKAVDVIQQSVSLPSYQSQSKDAIFMAVARLKLEFHNIMTRVTNANKGPSSTNLSSSMSDGSTTIGYEINVAYNSPSEGAINDLRRIAKRMNSAGYVGECFEVYKSVRKGFLVTSLKQLGIEKLSIRETRGLLLEEFKKKIDQLIRAAKVCYSVLFSRENKLFSQIFDGVEGDRCFSETIKDAEIQLMNFAEALITSRRSPDKLFKFLDLSKGLLDIWFLLDSTKFSGALILQSYENIGEVVRGILSDFEKSVVHELSTVPEVGGTIHSLTKYVMDYINLIINYKIILSDFIVSNPSTTFGDLVIPDVEFAQLEGRGRGRSSLSLHLVLTIVVLRFKLEDKSQFYKDASLAHLFMANNLHYIVQNIKESPELEELIGEEYTNKLSENYLRQAISNYQSSTCERMLYCLRDDDEGVRFLSSCFSSMRNLRRIKSFNAMFEEIRSTQARWVVQHLQLREELRVSIVEKLIPAYVSFLEQFKRHVEGRKYPYIKYSVEDLQTLIIKDFLRT